MVAMILAHPFRLAPDGAVTVVEQGSDAAVTQIIKAAVGTRIGERTMQSEFGTVDPSWHGLSEQDIQATLDDHGPDTVTVTSVTVTVSDEIVSVADVTWNRTSGGDDL